MLDQAIILATQAHIGQKRKHSGLPYITHPIDVMRLLFEWGVRDEIILSASLLHDVFEDTELTTAEVMRFDERVYPIVEELTHYPEVGKEVYLSSFIEPDLKSVQALVIKVADRICNVRDFLKTDEDYAKKYMEKANPLDVALHSRGHEIIASFSKTSYEAMTSDWFGLKSYFNRPKCVWCHKPIKGVVHYQGPFRDHPCHKKCLIVIGGDDR